MRACVTLTGILLATGSWVANQTQTSPADRIIERYLVMPYPENDPLATSRIARLAVLQELEGVPQHTVRSIKSALQRINEPRQRAELVEVLGRLHTTDAAKVLAQALKDPDERVRGNAICGLRLLARRVDRSGGKREQRGEMHEPAVPGLLTYLQSAANDPSEMNRVAALYALADTREPEAVKELERRLKDPSSKVRLKASCLLTEFNNATGLPEMKRALARLRKERDDVTYYFDAEMLLASFERITGKSFGIIAMNPLLSSDSRQISQSKQRYDELLETWAAWWAWEPKPPPAGGSCPRSDSR